MAATKRERIRNQSKRRMSAKKRSEIIAFYLFISPWLIGFIVLTLGPMVATLILSFTRYDLLTPPVWVGLQNFTRAFQDPSFWQAVKVTLTFAVWFVPLSLLGGLGIALLMNQPLRGINVFRTIYYIPAVVPAVASAVLWLWIFHPTRGILNNALGLFGLPKGAWPWWFLDPKWALPAIIIMSLWGVGGTMIIWLAGLKGIPQVLYEAATVDGAGRWPLFRYITLPQLSPVIFFNLILGLIGAFQVFTPAKLLSPGGTGGPEGSTLFYVLYLYEVGFGGSFQMGYAAALSWLLFIAIMVCTLLVIRSSTLWVYYESETK